MYHIFHGLRIIVRQKITTSKPNAPTAIESLRPDSLRFRFGGERAPGAAGVRRACECDPQLSCACGDGVGRGHIDDQVLGLRCHHLRGTCSANMPSARHRGFDCIAVHSTLYV